MNNNIRAVRRAKGLSLQQVAERCDPPTTPQTIGRLEVGTRTLSLDWIDRIALALEVETEELLRLPSEATLNIVAQLGSDGVHAPKKPISTSTARPTSSMVAVRVVSSVGDYRAGDEIWCQPLDKDWEQARNRDVLLPRPAGRFLFGRLLNCVDDKLHLLAYDGSQRQYVVTDPPWIAVATRLVRQLC